MTQMSVPETFDVAVIGGGPSGATAAMEQLFSSGRIVDLILALMIAEYIVLWLYLGRSVVALCLAGYLASGAFLLLALRVALTDEAGSGSHSSSLRPSLFIFSIYAAG